MKYNIKTKFFLASIFMLLPFMVLVGVVFYEFAGLRVSFSKMDYINKHLKELNSLQISINKSIMAPNDYIITGKKEYITAFDNFSGEVQTILKKIGDDLNVSHMKAGLELNEDHIQMEETILSDISRNWVELKKTSQGIFEIKSPIGNKKAISLMEEMDYKWGYPTIKRLGEWLDSEKSEMNDIALLTKSIWEQSFIILVVSFTSMILFSTLMTLKLSKIFYAPIDELNKGAEAITNGDLNHHITIRSGDEFEALANSFNIMGERLNNYYSELENRVAERTRELENQSNEIHAQKAELEAKTIELEDQRDILQKKIVELERFTSATIKREFRIKELKDELKRLKGVLLG